jgi:hypothetical protein
VKLVGLQVIGITSEQILTTANAISISIYLFTKTYIRNYQNRSTTFVTKLANFLLHPLSVSYRDNNNNLRNTLLFPESFPVKKKQIK